MIEKLEKLEKQDNNYKSKIMHQNKEDVKKAAQVKEQRKIQEAIISQRLIIQNVLTKANQFPQSDLFSQFQESKSSELSTLQESISKSISTLNEISSLLSTRLSVTLPSGSEDSLSTSSVYHQKLLPTVEDLVQKWHSRTQLAPNILNQKLNKRATTPLSALQQPVLTQVYKTLENKQFIDTRTHQKREVYRVLGKSMETIEEKIDLQIYDDKDFYQSIMRDLLNSSETIPEVDNKDGENVGIALTQEYLRKREKLRKLMQKKKKKSNKISKDRKLKYIIHDKLINFMAPTDTESMTDGRGDVLKILFGCTVDQKDAQTQPDDQRELKKQKLQEEEELDIGII